VSRPTDFPPGHGSLSIRPPFSKPSSINTGSPSLSASWLDSTIIGGTVVAIAIITTEFGDSANHA
jgi:hypothetical protein